MPVKAQVCPSLAQAVQATAAVLDAAVPFVAAVWAEDEAALVATVDALHDRATLSDTEFLHLRDNFDEAAILEILMLAGFYRTVSYLANGLALPLEDGASRFRDYA